MSEKENSQQNSGDTSMPLKSGDEPTELLLQLAWSPLETLIRRGNAKLFSGDGAICVVLLATQFDENLGLVPTQSVLPTQPTEKEQDAENVPQV